MKILLVNIGVTIHDCKCLKVRRFSDEGIHAKLYKVSTLAGKRKYNTCGKGSNILCETYILQTFRKTSLAKLLTKLNTKYYDERFLYVKQTSVDNYSNFIKLKSLY